MSSEPIEDGKKSETAPQPAGTPSVCPRCGAKITSAFATCWLCLETQGIGNVKSVQVDSLANPANVAFHVPEVKSDVLFSVVLAICGIMVILIGIGITIQNPGLLVPYLLVLGPILLASGVHGTQQLATTGHVEPRSLFRTVLIAAVTVFALVAALTVAFVIFLFVICFSVLGGGMH